MRLPPKYTLPVEFTERRLPGVVVPMPIFPSLLTNSKEEDAEWILRAAALPVALETRTESSPREEVALPTESDPNCVPPWTVNPVVVALPAIKFARLVKPVTPREPKDAPPLTVREVEVPAPKTKEPRDVPPWTVSPVVVALPTKSLPPNKVFETVRYVEEALTIVVLLPTGLTVKYALELLSIICKALAVWLAMD